MDFYKVDVPSALQGRVLFAGFVDERDDVGEAVGALPVVLLDFVLLRVPVFFLALDGRRDVMFVDRAINTIAGRECCRQRQSVDETIGAAVLQEVGQYVRGIGPEVGTEVLTRLGIDQLVHVLHHLMLVVTPGEVGISLREACFAQPFHDPWLGKGFREEDDVRMVLMDLSDEPLPEGYGFGVGIVHTEDAHATVYPVDDYFFDFLPEAFPLSTLKVDGQDVLVFFGRVLGVLHSAIWPPDEPLGMLLHPGVIGGTLQGKVKGDLNAEVIGLFDEALVVGKGAQLFVDGIVATVFAADRPGGAWLSRL